MNGGVGNFIGYLGTGWWFNECTQTGVTRWTIFWGVLTAFVVAILIYFAVTYRGQPEKNP